MNLITFDENDPLLKTKDKISLLKRKNFFIGDWCLNEENIFTLNKKKNKTPKYYHWDDHKKYEKDIVYLNKLYFKILKNLSKSLNLYHGTKYSTKYWELLLSRWILLYISYVFDRWEIVKSSIKINKISSTFVFKFDEKNFIPKNTISFNKIVTQNNYWNHWVFSEIIKFTKKTKIILVDPKKEIFYKDVELDYTNQFNFCFSKEKVFFYKFYIPLNLKLKLLYDNKQFSLKFSKKFLKNDIYNSKSRNSFYKHKKTKDIFLNFLNTFLVKNFPKIFLEEYLNLEKVYKNILWPKNPNFIVTTHAQYYDEIFKIYTAKKMLKGAKFLITQHGRNFGVEKKNFTMDMERKICDRFLTWGWKEDKKTYPLYITTVQGKKTSVALYKKKELLLIVYQSPLMPSRGLPPRTAKKRNFIFILNPIKLLQALDKKILQNVNISYKPKVLPTTEKKSILHKFPKIKFVYGSWEDKKYSHHYRDKFCLQIETFFSTGFLEAMYLNRPVILIFDNSALGANKDFLYYLEILKKENICFYNSKDAAKFINKTYNNIESWWNNKKLQKVRELFCKKYCKHSDDPKQDFKKSLVF